MATGTRKAVLRHGGFVVAAERIREGVRLVLSRPVVKGSGGGRERGRESAKNAKEEEEEKGAFVPVADVVAAFETRGCSWKTLAKIPSAEDEGYHVHVFQIYV